MDTMRIRLYIVMAVAAVVALFSILTLPPFEPEPIPAAEVAVPEVVVPEVVQQTQVRHYVTEVYAAVDGTNDLEQLHMFVGSDGRMGAVLYFGPVGTEPVVVGVSGPRTYTDVGEGGLTAFCFTVDSVEGPLDITKVYGEVSCWTWGLDDVVYETGNTPFGPVSSPPLTWCGEDHVAPSEGDTPPRVGL